jgi:hypothetical protein
LQHRYLQFLLFSKGSTFSNVHRVLPLPHGNVQRVAIYSLTEFHESIM